MGRHANRQIFKVAALAAVLCAIPLSAMAGEASFCVACSGPDQVYRCRVTGEGSIPSDALKLYCVIRTAKEGHHASCSAENATAACAGIDKVYTYDGPAIPEEIAQDPRVKSLMKRMNHENQAFEKPKAETPKTMVELTGRALSASRQGWRNAKAALGGGSSQDAQPLPVTPQAADAASATADSPSRMQRASSAMGNIARKSYRCLRSFFRHCREEASDTVQ
ncbi:hypothetical protein [Methyloceanibacter sp.]|uniref:hypothetical protein n=1 Tax=Methyloceanibacter sp. TaxID=1965321 RepID=UPI002D6A51E5|nr:hypothetical protein [Methyloceanibacter sp.]HZP08661.1 hypothetical protein [Methyloceanibacter sp.]